MPILPGPVFIIEHDKVDEMVRGPEGQAFVLQAAQAIRDQAKINNPSDDEKPYIFAQVWETGDTELAEGVGAIAVVGYDSAIWHIIEFGSVNNPPYRPMTAAAESVLEKFIPGDWSGEAEDGDV